MLTTQLITASDLHSRYVRLAERGLFPDLIRRLIIASDPSVRWLHFRAHEGIALGGWDGSIDEATGAAPYVPAGGSRWELGTNDDALAKLKSDFAKRNAAPEPNAAELALVFAVIRRRADKEDWARDFAAASTYREVHILDCDDLETWLHQHPGIHIWLSVMLGKFVEGALDVENWWLDWANQTSPVMLPVWLVAGRTTAQANLTAWLTQPAPETKSLSIFASTADEARAFCAACLLALPEEERTAWLTRTIIVTSEDIWQQLIRTATAGSLLLIPHFESDRIGELCAAATRRGHRVLLPRAATQAKATDQVVPPLGREALQQALEGAGLMQLDAAEKAGLARRSFTAFHRTLLTDKSLQQLWWQTPEVAARLLPLALLGRWTDSEAGDQEVVSALTGLPYLDVQRQLTEWAAQPNSPVRKIGEEWFLIDPADVWEQTARFLSPGLYEKFGEAIQRVLAQPLARFTLPPDERLYASFRAVRDTYSATLRQGLVYTLALVSSSLSAESGQQATLVAWVRHQLRQLLDQAFAEPSGALLASLNQHLPLLAEAAPDVFLTSLLRELQRADSVLPTLFQEERGLFHSVAHHTGLLWALEGLSWAPQYLSDAATVLAGLARLDPGGQLSNRPASSLRHIFLGWNPQTNATVPERLAVIDRLRREEPAVAWVLLLRLLPQHRDTSWPTHKPAFHWRDWQITPRQSINRGEYFTFIEGIANRLLTDAGTDASRWISVISDLPELLDQVDPDLGRRIMQQLSFLGTLPIPTDQRHQLLTKLRSFLNQHRSHPGVEWAWSEEQLAPIQELYNRLQPTDVLQRTAWYFDQWPKLPQGITERGYDHASEVIRGEQASALAELVAAHGLAFLPEFLALVPQPYTLGDAIGRSSHISDSDKTTLLQQYLASEQEQEGKFALGLSSSYAWQLGADNSADFIQQQTEHFTPAQTANWLRVMPMTPVIWQLAARLGTDVADQYWLIAPEYVDDKSTIATVAQQFLRHRRPLAAAHVLSLYHDQEHPMPHELALETLEQIAQQGYGNDTGRSPRGYELDSLLDELNNVVPENRSRAISCAFIFSRQSSYKLPAILDQALREDPLFFIEVLGYLYKPDAVDAHQAEVPSDDTEPTTEVESDNSETVSARTAFATLAWHVLHEWSGVPGSQPGGTFDSEQLKQWVVQARSAAAERRLTSSFSTQLGKLLSHAPANPDGSWPHHAVCEIIQQERENLPLRQNFHTGCFNRHGRTHAVTGGIREQAIADEYATWAAQHQVIYPAAASLLRELADTFNQMAEDERRRAARDDQFGT